MRSSEVPAAGPIQITGLGLVSALGLDAATCCAAAHAGITRAQAFSGFTVVDADGAEAGIAAHCLPMGTDGFEGDARLLQLLTMALRDIGPVEPVTGGRGALLAYLALPDPRRWPHLQGDKTGADEVPLPPDREAAARRGAALWALAATALGRQDLPALREVHATGHTAFHRALAQAARDIRSGAASMALVGAVDSFIDAQGLGRLAAAGRLKTPVDGAGLQPGEAAGFVLLVAADSDQPPAKPPLAILRALAFAQEPNASYADGAPTGRGIAKALHEAARHLSISRHLPVWACSDHNGEVYRAMDWGNALVQIEDQQSLQLKPEVLYPAACVGDTGAASGVVALCMAATAFSRGYAPASVAALVSCADGGERSALLCQQP